MLKIWHYLNNKGHFYLCVDGKQIRFWTFPDAFGKFHEVSQSRNMLQLGVERCGSVSVVCRYVLTITSVKILRKCENTSLTVTNIAVSLMLKVSSQSRKFEFNVFNIIHLNGYNF